MTGWILDYGWHDQIALNSNFRRQLLTGISQAHLAVLECTRSFPFGDLIINSDVCFYLLAAAAGW